VTTVAEDNQIIRQETRMIIVHNIAIIAKYYNQFAMRNLQEFEIGYAEYGVLMYLAANENTNQEAIAQHYSIDKGAIAKTMKKLESKCYVDRQINKKNQREKLITLTELGRTIIEEMRTLQKEWNDILLQGITPEEKEIFIKLTEKVFQNASNYINGGALHESKKE
jgi:DNA-binding MarR family transcriptional regulator